jgi:hypothetical protein
MQRMLSILVTLAWGLWFGGLIMLFVAVTSLFNTFKDQRPIAGAAAADIFHRFEVFQLALAAAALLATLAWRILSGRSKLKMGVLVFFALATLVAMSSTTVVTPKIDALRRQAQTATPEFKKLHGVSMMLYVGEATLLLCAGLLLPPAIRRDASRGSAKAGSRGFEVEGLAAARDVERAAVE